MISGNFISNTGTNLNLYVTWESEANVSTNTSTVTAKVYMRSYTISGTALADSYITINGNKKSFANKSLSVTTNSLKDTLLATHTVEVEHGADGKKSITIKANLEFNGTVSGKYLSDITTSKSINLENIPRSSTFSVSSTVNTGSKLTIGIVPANANFTHKFEFFVGSTRMASGTSSAGVTSYIHTIPHSWSPTSDYVTVTLYCYTMSGTTQISKVKKTFRANVPTNIRPKVTNVTTALVSGLSGQYVQGKSKVTLTATAEAGSGSTLTSYIFKGANINGTSSSYTGTSNAKTSSAIQSVGNVKYIVCAKDARGRESDDYEVSINVYAYATPQISSITAQRCLKNGTIDINGTYAKVTVKFSYADVNKANTRTVKLASSVDNFSAKTTVVAATATNTSYSGVYGGSFALDETYQIKAIITDKYTSHEKTITLKVAQRTINIARYGNGVAIGGLSTVDTPSTNGKFECNWDTEINAKLAVTNNITTKGDFGCTEAYDGSNFAMYCQWADSANHDILVRNSDGVTMGLGWKGDDEHPTILDVRPTKVNIRGATHFQCTNDASTSAQNDVPVRVGNASGAHIDIDGNEIIAKDSATELGTLNLGGKIIALYVDDIDTLRTSSDSTSTFVKSVPTYNRTYDGSPNVYITSNGIFGRSVSSSQRYKTEIEDVHDDILNPYNILDIPIRQYKYNTDHVPVGKDAHDVYIGMIAEEVAQAYPAAAEYNEDGQVEMWNIKTIVPAMLKIIQDQQKAINELKQKVDELEMKN